MQGMLKMASRPDAAKRWRTATTLIIDEVIFRSLLVPLYLHRDNIASAQTGCHEKTACIEHEVSQLTCVGAAALSQISMVDGGMLDNLEEVARSVRRCKQPFGGLQLILTGDFHQLPPVAKGRQAMAGTSIIHSY